MYLGNVFLNKELKALKLGLTEFLLNPVLLALPSSQAGQLLPVGRALLPAAEHAHLGGRFPASLPCRDLQTRRAACSPYSSQKSGNLR